MSEEGDPQSLTDAGLHKESVSIEGGLDIRLGEVVTLEEQGKSGHFRQGIHKAIGEVETRRVITLPDDDSRFEIICT